MSESEADTLVASTLAVAGSAGPCPKMTIRNQRHKNRRGNHKKKWKDEAKEGACSIVDDEAVRGAGMVHSAEQRKHPCALPSQPFTHPICASDEPRTHPSSGGSYARVFLNIAL